MFIKLVSLQEFIIENHFGLNDFFLYTFYKWHIVCFTVEMVQFNKSNRFYNLIYFHFTPLRSVVIIVAAAITQSAGSCPVLSCLVWLAIQFSIISVLVLRVCCSPDISRSVTRYATDMRFIYLAFYGLGHVLEHLFFYYL